MNLNSCSNSCKYKNQAVVSVPVIDLTLQPLQDVYGNKNNIEKLYSHIPFAEGEGYFSCVRVHQLLFNEIVDIIKEENGEVLCKVPNIFFETSSKIPINQFWTLKKNLKPLSKLKELDIDISAIPAPYANDLQELLINNNILTLVFPYYDYKAKQYYSAGTRFKRLKSQDTEHYYAVILLDFNKNEKYKLLIPKDKAVVSYSENKNICRKRFVNILKEWANQYKGVIPYLTGGCSFIDTYKDNNFQKEHKTVDVYGKKREISFWDRSNYNNPKSGIDCSCLIARAAQIAGMPYYFKNTVTLSKYLDSLQKNQPIEEGDLIWYNGHVLIISDIENNKVIESVGYPFGYGLVHEKELKYIFKDINTYNDLLNLYFNQKPLERLDNMGQVARTVSKFEIFKINSTWEKYKDINNK